MRFLCFHLFILLASVLPAQTFVSFLELNRKAEAAVSERPLDEAEVQFYLREGMMVVEATVNQQTGHFIIDTGAPTLVLNQRPTSDQITTGRGISQSLAAEPIEVEQFHWSGLSKSNFTAYRLDISHLESSFGQPLAGIIGYDILKEVTITVDHDRRTLRLRPLRKAPKAKERPLVTIPFTMQGHLPVIRVKIGKRRLNLALDTASESNILSKKAARRLDRSFMSNWRSGEMQGIDQLTQLVSVADVNQTRLRKLSLETMPYWFLDLTHLEKNGLHIDGLLGYPFFRQHRVSINYREQKIYIYP